MSDESFYYCQHCGEEVCISVQCPCCGLGTPPPSPIDELLKWLKVHSEARNLIYRANKDNYDYGYMVACKVIEAELRRLIEEHKDGSDRVRGN